MGMAFWILPRFGLSGRGNETLIWLAYALINIGVLAVGLGGTLAAPPAIMFAGRLAELLSVALFAIHAWPRVKPVGA